ncbi:hypothetical protein DL95DRAFT_460500 [Leptodontidium sp. 2 PMI_412]|nr:hypothetical protein DL95DRAFT_460500 [Leptodontidium sp. 2 PMI_412]
MLAKCLPIDDPANQWKYCPSVPAAFILFVLFACTTLFHIFQAFRYRKAFCWVLIMGGLWETLSFASRIASHTVQARRGSMTLHFFCSSSRHYSVGGGLLSLSKTAKTANLGLHVYTGGVIFQQLLIICFLALTVKFKSLLRRDVSDRGTRQQGVVMIRVLRFSLLLITFRILFRIVEFSFSQGTSVNQYINHHEFFVYVFDAVPMFFALLLMNVWHPGKKLNDDAKGYSRSQSEDTVLQTYAYARSTISQYGAPQYPQIERR